MTKKITCISDLHGFSPDLPGGDLLIIAGDMTARDSPQEWTKFFQWLEAQKYRKKIFIAGNHDNHLIDHSPSDTTWEYLRDSGTEFEGLKIWGSPWTKTFIGMNPHCKAFTLGTEVQLAEKWDLIPEDTQILITHSPPYGYLDEIQDMFRGKILSVGSTSLMKKIPTLPNLRLHVFGHVHEGFGRIDKNGLTLINASHVNEHYDPIHKPVCLELE